MYSSNILICSIHEKALTRRTKTFLAHSHPAPLKNPFAQSNPSRPSKKSGRQSRRNPAAGASQVDEVNIQVRQRERQGPYRPIHTCRGATRRARTKERLRGCGPRAPRARSHVGAEIGGRRQGGQSGAAAARPPKGSRRGTRRARGKKARARPTPGGRGPPAHGITVGTRAALPASGARTRARDPRRRARRVRRRGRGLPPGARALFARKTSGGLRAQRRQTANAGQGRAQVPAAGSLAGPRGNSAGLFWAGFPFLRWERGAWGDQSRSLLKRLCK